MVEQVVPYAGLVVSTSPVIVHGAIARPSARVAAMLGDRDLAER